MSLGTANNRLNHEDRNIDAKVKIDETKGNEEET